jgi:hypothetical protein
LTPIAGEGASHVRHEQTAGSAHVPGRQSIRPPQRSMLNDWPELRCRRAKDMIDRVIAHGHVGGVERDLHSMNGSKLLQIKCVQKK